MGRKDVSLLRGPGHGHLLHGLPREGRAEGDPVWYLVPDGVVQYIAKYELYAAPAGNSSSEPTETIVSQH